MLDADYRRLWDPSLPVMRPQNADRYQRFLLACAGVALIVDGKRKDMRQRAQRARQRTRERPQRLLGPDGRPIAS